MLVVQIDVVRAETLEGAVEGELDIGRCADRLATAKLAFGIIATKFGGEENVRAPSCLLEPFPELEFG